MIFGKPPAVDEISKQVQHPDCCVNRYDGDQSEGHSRPSEFDVAPIECGVDVMISVFVGAISQPVKVAEQDITREHHERLVKVHQTPWSS